ncbi:type II secretion system protein GspD [Pigmentiphaga aceris]|uniref:Type II secretion system protein GspD n=1 Tax=Pigmentiphaga aceris TaxID=1940612 RepID=A0A5C0B3Q4_9BURK|nr:type II secretion system secretin GspD [Pigmentiphaga aceris]QEI09529.1 type II secretion system protein GspD [Pigmentiphaga aceris]
MLGISQHALAADSVPGGAPAQLGTPAGNERVVLNFVDAELPLVVRALAQFTGRNFLVDPRVKGQVTLVSDAPVSPNTAYNMLVGALRMQGFSAVDVGGVTRIVPEADAKLQGGAVGGTGAGGELATRTFRLNYENATNLVQVLRPMISPNNPINAYPGNNTLVVTDYADNLERIARVIANIDTPSAINTDVVPIRHGVASDVAMLASQLLDGGQQADAGQRIAVVADPRSNSVLLRSSSPARTRLARELVVKLDNPDARPGNLHVVYLRNAQATKLAEVLRGALTGQMDSQSDSSSSGSLSGNGSSGLGGLGSSSSNGSGGFGSSNGSVMGNTGGTMVSAGMGGGIGSQGMGRSNNSSSNNGTKPVGFSAGGATVQADPTTNTLIISAPDPLYRSLREIIDQLDHRRAQVLVESLIVEVSTDLSAEAGIQWAGGGRSVVGGTNLGGSGFNPSGLTTLDVLGSGLSLGVLRGTVNIAGVEVANLNLLARALQSRGGANILSTPNLLTLDNEQASIVVGKTVPFVTGQYITSGGGTSNNPFQTVQREDVGLTLRVRPQISEGGTVKLEIYQEVSSIDERLTNSAGIVTNKRAIETNVLVDDGQIIVLGGLIEDTVSEVRQGVPVLSDIPLLGGLFRYDTRQRGKTNLMVFLRPYVVRDAQGGNRVTLDRYDYMRRLQSQMQPGDHAVLPTMGAPLLPPAQVPSVPATPVAYDLRPQAQVDLTRAQPPVTETMESPRQLPGLVVDRMQATSRGAGVNIASDPAALYAIEDVDVTVLQVASTESQRAADVEVAQLAAAGLVGLVDLAPGGGEWRVRIQVPRNARALDESIAKLRGLGYTPQLVARP